MGDNMSDIEIAPREPETDKKTKKAEKKAEKKAKRKDSE